MKRFLRVFMPLVLLIVLVSCGNKEIVISFETNGGTSIEDMVIDNDITSIDLPSTSKEGYVFEGWYFDEELSEPFSVDALINESAVTLYAKWGQGEEVSYTITFNSEGGSTVDDIVVMQGATLTKPSDPTKEGYIFDGWYIDNDVNKPFDFSSLPENNITLHAKWKVEEVEVTIEIYVENLNQIFELDQTLVVNFEKNETYTYNPQDITGFVFDENNTLNVLEVVAGSSDVVKAYYVRKTTTISFETFEGSEINDITGLYGKNFDLPNNPTKDGYTFIGWFLDQDLTQILDEQVFLDTDMMLYAKWEKDKSTLVFDTMGGESIENLVMLDGQTLTLPTPTKEGYSFVGWYETNALDVLFNETTMPFGYTVIYAKWEVETYTLSFDTNGGTSIMDATYAYMENISAPDDPTKEGYIFVGWYSDQMLNSTFAFQQMPAQNITIYAKWVDASDETTIVYKMNHTPFTEVVISGIVYAKQEVAGYGYYIYDETGYVFINANQNEVDINQLVTIEGQILTQGSIKYIGNVENVEVNASDQVEKTAVPLSMAEVAALEGEEVYLIHNLYEAEAILYQNEFETLEFVDLNTFDHIEVYDMFTRYNKHEDLLTKLLSKVSYTYVLVYYADTYMIGLVDYEVEPLTFDEIVDIYSNIDVEPFYVEEDPFVFTTVEDLGYVNIDVEAIGENAMYYDQDKQKFNSINEEEITIDFAFTITNKLDESMSETITIPVVVKAIESDSISDLLNGEVGETFIIDAIVVSTSDEYLAQMVLKDDTGMVLADHYNYLHIGDRVLIQATKQLRGNQVYLSYDDNSLEIIKKLSTGKDLALDPAPMTLDELALLDASDPSIYGQYIELQGFLTYDLDNDFDVKAFGEYFSYYMMINDEVSVKIMEYGTEAFSKLENYMFSEVMLKGFISSDGTDIMILYEGIREDAKIPDFTDLETVEAVKQGLIYQIGSIGEIPPMITFESIPYSIVYGTEISWDFTEETLLYFDLDTMTFKPTYMDHDVEVLVTITKGDAEINFSIEAVLKGIEITPLSDISSLEEYESFFTKGVIAYWHPDFSYVIDDMGQTILVNEHLEGVKVGDEVVLSVYCTKNFGMTQLNASYYYDDIVIDVLSENNDVDINYTLKDIETINQYDAYEANNYHQWLTLFGKLNIVNDQLVLENGSNHIDIFTPDMLVYDQLAQYKGELININGLVKGYNGNVFEFIYLGLDDDIEVLSFTDIEKVDMTKQIVIDRFSKDLIAESSFDFYEPLMLFDGEVSMTYTLEDEDDANILLFESDYIGDVDIIRTIAVSVTLTCRTESTTFLVDVTVTPNDDVDQGMVVTNINDAILDLSQTYMIYGQVKVFVIDQDGNAIFIIDDTTMAIRVILDDSLFTSYNNYVDAYLYFTGTINQDLGYYQMVATDMIDERIYMATQSDFTNYTLEEMNNLDLADQSIYGRPVIISGDITVEYVDYQPYYYIDDGTNRVSVTNKYIWGELSAYIGYHVEIYGFILGENPSIDINEICVFVDSYKSYDEHLPIELHGYTEQEVLDTVVDAMYTSTMMSRYTLQPNDVVPYVSMPYEIYVFDNQFGPINIESEIVVGQEYLAYDNEKGQFVFMHVDEDKDIVIRVTVSMNGLEKTYEVTYVLNGYVLNTLEELYEVEANTAEIALDAVYLYSIDRHHYFYIENQIYQFEGHLDSYINEDYSVTIIGKKQTINGVSDYTYEFYAIENSFVGFGTTPETVTMMQLYYQNENDPLHQKFLNIKGEVGYDPYLDAYTLSDQGLMIYLRTSSYQQSEALERFINYRISINGCIPHGLVVRDEYLVFDIYSKDMIYLEDLSVSEELNQIAKMYQEAYDDTSYYGGEPLGFMLEPPYYNSHIVYHVANEADEIYFDDTYVTTNIVDEAVTIDLIGTVIYSLDESQTLDFPFSITLLPKENMTISQVEKALVNDVVHTTGVVVDTFYYNNDLDWLVIDDGENLLYIEVDNMYLFDYESVDVEVGDEVSIVGIIDRFADMTNYISKLTAVKVIQENQVVLNEAQTYTLEDIKNLNHLNTDSLTYVLITAKLTNSNIYLYLEDDITYISNTNNPYQVILEPVYNIDIYGDLTDLIGDVVEVKGYLHVTNRYNNPYWALIVTDITLVEQS